MKRRLILHIGAHRTATSSIQEYLFRNFDNLMTVGFFFPLRLRRHVIMMNRVFKGEIASNRLAQNLDDLANSKDADLHTLILSDEDVCMRRDLTPLAGFREVFDVKVFFSLRRQDLWLESWYLQNIKWQWNPTLAHCSFEEFMTRRKEFFWVHYDAYVRHLEKVFGAENVILNVFEKDQMPGGPVETFCNLVGLEERSQFKQAPAVNASRSPVMSEFMRHLPLDMAVLPVRARLVRALETVDAEVLGHGRGGSEKLLPPDRRRAILAEYEAGNAALARRYFGREQLFLDPLPVEGAALAELALPAQGAELMEQLVVPFFQALIEQENIAERAGKNNTD